MRRRDARRLQKAVNHANKLLKRLAQLQGMGIGAFPYENSGGDYYTLMEIARLEAEHVRKRLLLMGRVHGVELDEEGMPR